MTLPSPINGYLQNIQKFVKSYAETLNQAQNTGQNLGYQIATKNPILPISPKSVAGEILNPKGKLADIPKDYKNYSPQVMPALGSDIAEGPAELKTGTSLLRDKRMTVDNPNAYKVNPNPRKATYSVKQETPSSGLTPDDKIAGQSAILEPSIKSPTRRPISYTTTDIGTPGKIHISTDTNIGDAPALANAQKAVDNIPGKTATDKFNNWESRMSELSNNIDDYNLNNPVNIPEAEIKTNILNRVKPFIAPEGMTPAQARVNGFLSREEANIMADDTIFQLKKQAGITTQGSIPINQVTQMKQSFNKIYGQLLAKRASGGELTAAQQIQLSARDGLDTAIGQYQPNIKQMSLEQSGLYDAQPQLAKQVNTEYSGSHQPSAWERFNSQSLPAKATEVAGGLATGSFIGSKILPTAVGAGAYALNNIPQGIKDTLADNVGIGPVKLSQLPDLIKGYDKNRTSKASDNVGEVQDNKNGIDTHTTSIAPVVKPPVSQNEILPDKNGHIGVYDSFGPSGVATNTLNYGSQMIDYTNQISALKGKPGYSLNLRDQAKVAELTAKKDNITNLYNLGQSQLAPGQKSALNDANLFNSANDLLGKADPSILSTNDTYDKLKTITEGPYANLGLYIHNLEQASGVPIFVKGMDKKVLAQNLLAATQTLMWKDYYSGLNVYTGGQQPQPTSQVAPMPQPNPQGMSNIPQGGSFQLESPNPNFIPPPAPGQ